jgi:hypothetical protein
MKDDGWCTVTEIARCVSVIWLRETLREIGERMCKTVYAGAKKTSPAITKATKLNNGNCH